MIAVTRRLVCDRCGAIYDPYHQLPEDITEQEMRDRAADDGWKVGQFGGPDYCDGSDCPLPGERAS